MGQVEQIYKGADRNETIKLIKKYHINYVLVSNRERDKLGPNAGDLVRTFSLPVYHANSAVLYYVDWQRL
jgi:uncharacterized membrane protein